METLDLKNNYIFNIQSLYVKNYLLERERERERERGIAQLFTKYFFMIVSFAKRNCRF